MKNISISSGAFKNGGIIPDEYTCSGRNISPPLEWTGIPENTVSIVLIMVDPDAQMRTFVHWILFNIPPTARGLPENIPKTETLEDFSRHGVNEFGDVGYGGPCPPPGKYHRYYFRVCALDKVLGLLSGSTIDQVLFAMKGRIIKKGELMGIYKR